MVDNPRQRGRFQDDEVLDKEGRRNGQQVCLPRISQTPKVLAGAQFSKAGRSMRKGEVSYNLKKCGFCNCTLLDWEDMSCEGSG